MQRCIYLCKYCKYYANPIPSSSAADPLPLWHWWHSQTPRGLNHLIWPPLADLPSVSAPWIIDISLIIILSTQLEWSDANYEAGQLRGWLGLHCSLYSVFCWCRKLKKYIRHLWYYPLNCLCFMGLKHTIDNSLIKNRTLEISDLWPKSGRKFNCVRSELPWPFSVWLQQFGPTLVAVFAC